VWRAFGRAEARGRVPHGLWDTLWLVLVLVLVLLAVAVFMLLWAKIHEAVDRIRSKFSAVVPFFVFFFTQQQKNADLAVCCCLVFLLSRKDGVVGLLLPYQSGGFGDNLSPWILKSACSGDGERGDTVDKAHRYTRLVMSQVF